MNSESGIGQCNIDNSFSSEEDPKDSTSQIIEHDPTGRFCKYNEEIGKGAYKSVFRGYDKESGCEVAWNVFLLESVPENERRRAKQEISILKSLKHQNIINFIHSWHNKKEIVFITEIVNGGSLKNYMRRITRPKLKVIKYWCQQILNGLDYLHSKRVIHRDLKCENILIDTNNNELKIGDLGLSIYSVLGTPEFMAPEIYQEHYDTKVDIYAFGMCMLEMITGKKPFCECRGGQGQVMKKVFESQKPQSLEAIQNERIKQIVQECLKPALERPTANQLLNSYFNSVSTEDENQAVSINEQLLLQLSGESKNSSVLSYNISKQLMQTNSSIKMAQINTSNLISVESIAKKQQNEVKLAFNEKKVLSIETEDDYSLDQQFSKQYRNYIITQNDETLQDLDQRQERELQLLLQLHKMQKMEFTQKAIQIPQRKPTAHGSGFISPNSFQTLFEFSNAEQAQTVQPIAESPSSEEDGIRKSLPSIPKLISENKLKNQEVPQQQVGEQRDHSVQNSSSKPNQSGI